MKEDCVSKYNEIYYLSSLKYIVHVHFVFCIYVVGLFKFGDQLIDAVCLCVTDDNHAKENVQ